MIVISGALVVVALILLVIGLAIGSLGFVYASIGVSVLSFASLLIGVLQRRREAVPGVEGAAPAAAATQSEDDTSVAPVRRASDASTLTGSVLVVEGRPRYHVAGCRYLTGKTAESVDVGTALDQGFSACGVCKPDEALTAAGGDSEAPAADETAAIAVPTEDIVPARAAKATRLVKAPTGRAVKAPARAAAPARKAAPAKRAAAKAAPAKKAAAKAAPARKAAPAKAPVKKAPANKAPVKKAPAKKAPAKKAPAKKATRR